MVPNGDDGSEGYYTGILKDCKEFEGDSLTFLVNIFICPDELRIVNTREAQSMLESLAEYRLEACMSDMVEVLIDSIRVSLISQQRIVILRELNT